MIKTATENVLALLIEPQSEMTMTGMVQQTFAAVKRLGAQLIEALCAEIERRYDEQRNRKNVIVRSRVQSRRLLTQLGEITLERKLYFDKAASRYFYAVDDLLKLEKYSRIEKGMQAELVANATMTSYGKASELAECRVSRQTVHNIVHKLKAEKINVASASSALRYVDDIYIEADEDHIHLQNGRSAEVKLIYVHEGVKQVSKTRSELENVRYFVSLSNNGDTIWEEAVDYIYSTYACSKANIHLSGDGAAWIKYGLEVIPGAIYHLDKFHVYKSVTTVSMGSRALRNKILAALKREDYKQVEEIYAEHYNERTKRSERNTISKGLFYLKNNFNEIDLTPTYSCAAEGHVSHVLSARLSSRPMGWSIHGAECMAKLRAYYFNGGNFHHLFNKTENTKETFTPYRLQANARRKSEAMPTAHVVGLDGVTNGVAVLLRSIVHHGENRKTSF